MTESLISALALTALLGVMGWFLKKLIWSGSSAKSAVDYGKKLSAYLVFITAISSSQQFIRKDLIDAIASLLINIIIFPLIGFAVGYIYGALKQRKYKIENIVEKSKTEIIINTNTNNTNSESIKNNATNENIFVIKNINEHNDKKSEETIWEETLNEFQSPNRKKGTWAKCLAESLGDESKAQALYLRLRFSEIKEMDNAKNHDMK